LTAEDGTAQSAWKQPLWAPARLLARTLADFAFPPQALDGGPGPQWSGLTPGAWSKVTFLEAPWCEACGAPFEHPMGEGVLCASCDGRARLISRCRAACVYDEHSRDLVLGFKHADRTELGKLFALWLARAGAELLEEADAVAPVPLHPIRLLGRRYNQAAEMARPLARRAGRPYLADALVRTRQGTQGGKSKSGRRRAVAAAFAVPAGRRSQVSGRRILLVDDVMTTGSTLDACARALLKAGARSVDALVVARVRER
jgi:ComF family protein